MPFGHSRLASSIGMAEPTPYFLASRLAVVTTDRGGGDPTMTGFPLNEGLSRCSTDAKKGVHVQMKYTAMHV